MSAPMKIQIEISGEQADALFAEGTIDWTPREIERVEFHGTRRREIIRRAIIRRLPS